MKNEPERYSDADAFCEAHIFSLSRRTALRKEHRMSRCPFVTVGSSGMDLYIDNATVVKKHNPPNFDFASDVRLSLNRLYYCFICVLPMVSLPNFSRCGKRRRGWSKGCMYRMIREVISIYKTIFNTFSVFVVCVCEDGDE